MRSPHYLTPLLTTRIPRCHFAFDCETQAEHKGGRYSHRWVCGAAAEGRLDDEGYWGHDYPISFTTPEHLWAYITGQRRDGKSMVVWAHNLSFDLRVSEALRWLPVYGYTLEAVVLEKTASWASFTSDHGPMTVCDLHSWLPVPLAKVGAAVGLGRSKVKYASATREALVDHCVNDTLITIEAVGQIVEWLERNDAGSFRPTGSGQSHAMWRRRWLPKKTVLVHGDETALERERVAMWTGRAEAWRWGKHTGPLYEHDLNLAYCRIAAGNPVPVKLVQRTGRTDVQSYLEQVKRYAILADVTIETDTPTVPTSEAGRVFWPVGKFNTTLWNPELDLAIGAGANVTIHRTWRYLTAPVLASMAEYIIGCLEGGGEVPNRVVRVMLKHWARTLVGRCALRYREWDDYGSVSSMGLSLSTLLDSDTGHMTELLQVGYRIMELTDLAEADSSVPQITGWVMSQARAILWTVMQVAGLENLYYVDTDSVLVNVDGNRRLEANAIVSDAGHLTPKASFTTAHIYGPRNLVLEGERRISGIPKKAIRTGELSFDGEVWSGLRASLESRRHSEVAITPRSFDVDDGDPRRLHVEQGYTLPFRLENDA